MASLFLDRFHLDVPTEDGAERHEECHGAEDDENNGENDDDTILVHGTPEVEAGSGVGPDLAAYEATQHTGATPAGR